MSAPSGGTISVTSARCYTATATATISTLGTNATYLYYVRRCATNSTAGTMYDCGGMSAVTSSQTVELSGLPASTTSYLFIAAKNTSTLEYTVMTTSGVSCTTTAGTDAYDEKAILKSIDATSGDYNGNSVASSGNYLLVGAPYRDSNKGAVYAYEMNATTSAWDYVGKLTANDGVAEDKFGTCVAISGTYAIIGAQYKDSNVGTAYIFERNSSSGLWEQKQRLSSTYTPVSYFGAAVSISGTYAVVGSPYTRWSTYTTAGIVVVFERNSDTAVWDLKTTLNLSNAAQGDMFGSSVSICGTLMIAGAPRKQYSAQANAGAAYVYTRQSGTWTLTNSLLAANPISNTYFGTSVCTDGTFTYVGAVGWSQMLPFFQVFNGNTMVQQIQSSDSGISSGFGNTISCDGTIACMGIIGATVSGLTLAGCAVVFHKMPSGTWTQTKKIVSSTPIQYTNYGNAVCVSGGNVVVGSAIEGKAFVYSPVMAATEASGATLSNPIDTSSTTGTVTLALGTLGVGPTYSYVISRSSTNSPTAVMTDCGTAVATTSSQTVSLTDLTSNVVNYLWARAVSNSTYIVLSPTSVSIAPISIGLSSITPISCTATVTIPSLGTANAYNYFLCSSPTNSTSGTMTNLKGLLGQTLAQVVSLSGLSPSTTYYLFLRMQSVSDSSYTYLSSLSTTLTTTAGVSPSGGSCTTPISVTSISATVTVAMTALGTNSIYNYFVSSSPTNSTSGTMTNLKALTAQTASQSAQLTLLAPSTTSYLFIRAQNIVTGSYTFMTTTGVALTTLGTGSAPSGSTISVTSAASTTAVIAVTMTTLGTDANYVYYVSWCASDAVGGTMANVCLLKAQAASQTVKPSGLPAGTSPYLFVRAKNVLTGAYTVMSASGTSITLSAATMYYEAAALTAFDPFASDSVGFSVAVSGTYAAIGSYAKKSQVTGITGAGGCYILELNGTTGEWEHKSALSVSEAYTNDQLGWSVAISGTFTVISSVNSDPTGKVDAGAAYVFERNIDTGVWEQKSKLFPSDSYSGDSFGASVSVSGTYIIVGSRYMTQLGVRQSGGAYVFERNAGSGVWEQTSFLFPSDSPTASYFGASVSVSGTYAIVGAYNKNGGSGGAYIFERNSGSGIWEEKKILTCSDSTISSFGYSVALDGTYAVVGATRKTVNSITVAGGAYMFERVSDIWTQTSILDNPDPVNSDTFGYSVSISGQYVVIGCPAKDPSSKTSAGATYLYKRNSSTGVWENKIEWVASDGLASDQMGCCVSISGTRVVSGACYKIVTGVSNAGGAYVYELPSSPGVSPTASISVANYASSVATVTIDTLGTDATYTYVVSRSTTNSSTATMTDCGTCIAQTAQQTVTLTGLTALTTYYFWVRSKVASSSAYTVISSSSAAKVVTPPSVGGVSVNSNTPLTCNAVVTMSVLGTTGYFNYYVSSATTNSTSATMTDLCGLRAQTTSQTMALSGLTPSTTRYLFVRAQNAVTGEYIVISNPGTTMVTSAAVAPSGGSIGTPSSVTSISATVTVTLTTLGTDSIYNYFLSSSPTNSTSGNMTNLRALAAQTPSQSPSLSLLAPSTTSYLFVRAQNVKTGAYTFMTTTGVALTTLGTGSAPSGATISVTSAASTTAVVAVTLTTLGTNANYMYYLSWCATNSTGGTMANVCLLAKQGLSQTVYPSGLPAGTSPYLFVRAKNVLTGTYTVMSASGTVINMSASNLYYEAAALTAFDPASSGKFGYGVAVGGNYAVVGAYTKDVFGLSFCGAAYVLELNGSTGEWEHKSFLYASDGYTSDRFGCSVSVSGTYAVFGAYLSDPGGKIDAGAAYVFERNAGTGIWEQTTKLIASDASPGDNFGANVSVSGTYSIVGAPNRTQLGNSNSGGAYVFERNSGSGVWEQKAVLFPSDLFQGFKFGNSVSVSESYAIVAANANTGDGRAYIFERNSGSGVWEEKVILTCSDSTSADFGYSVSIDGTYAVVGARNKTVKSVSGAGCAYIFERVSGTWTQTAVIENPDPDVADYFGNSVGVSGVNLAIGCWAKNPASKADAGATYLYRRNSTTGAWENKIEWTASDGLTNDAMGVFVGISGTHVISSAYGKAVTGLMDAGGAYIHELPSNADSLVLPSGATLSAATVVSATTATVDLAIDTIGTDATYAYVVSWTSTNVSSATMTDCGTAVAQTASQTVALTGLSANTTYYLWARAKVSSSSAYTLLTTTSVSVTTPPIAISSITPLTCTATVTMPTVGTANAYNYFLCSSPINSTSGTMTDLAGLLRQTSAQTVSVSGLSPNTTQYLFVRWQAVSDSSYTYVSSTGVALTTSVGVAPSGGTCGTPSSVTSISATVAVTLTTLGTDSIYNYFLSASPTNSTSDTMTNLKALTAQTSSQNATLTLLAPSTTLYLFIRAQDVKTGSYTFMTTTGVTLTTLSTGNAPSGATIFVASSASTTAVVAVTMTTLGTNANYVYYVSWCATNSTGGTMANVCLLKAQTSSQVVYPSGLPAGTSPYLFVRAKNVLTGAYTVMSATGTAITMSASSIYYEAAALTAFDPVHLDYFGHCVAVSGSYAVIGSYKKDPVGLVDAGSAYIFEQNGTTGEWEFKSFLYPSDDYSGDSFAASVAVSGSYAVIGTKTSDPGGKVDAGAAYMYERNSSTNAWEQSTKLLASDAMPGDNFGVSVSVSGMYAIVGASGRPRLGIANTGGAYIFERNSTSGVWEQKTTLLPGDLTTGSSYGYSVAVCGSYAIVGAYGKSGGGGAYIYEKDSGTGAWVETANLTCSDSAIGGFGVSVSIDGTSVAIGAFSKTVNSITLAGGAYIFERVSGTWTQTAILDNPDPVSNDRFGQAVSLSGSCIVTGCQGKDPASKSGAGSTYLYKRNSSTGAWENKIQWTASDGLAGDGMGISVGISGTHVISGAYTKTVTGVSYAGGAYVYELPSNADTLVVPSGATLSSAIATSATTANVTLTIDTLGTDATYSYVISRTSTNSSSATMTDCGTAMTQTASQTVALSGMTVNTTYYLWVRAKIASSGVPTLISTTSVSVTTLPIALSSITPLTCTATVTLPSVGTALAYNYFLSSASTNSTSATMTDLSGLLRQTTAQTVSVSGLSPNTTQYLFVRWQAVSDSSYTYVSSAGAVLTTTAGVAPSGFTCNTPSSVTSISATVWVSRTTLGTDSIYNYFLSSSPTNSTDGTMTNLMALAAVTGSTSNPLTLLAPSTTSYLFIRAQDIKTGNYTFMTTTGVTLTTLGTGSAPSGSSISITSVASTTAVLIVSMTNLGTNANYVYYISWCATNSTAGTMTNVCLLKAQTSAQTVYPSGLPAGTTAYLFMRARNVLTGDYIVMSATGTAITMSAASVYYEAAALVASDFSGSSYNGFSVSVDNTYAISGARAKTVGYNNYAGGAYFMELNPTTGEWDQVAIVSPSDVYAIDYFGSSVSISGTYALSAAPYASAAGKINAGAVYVFERSGTWVQTAKLIASDGAPSDFFGSSVAVSGSYAIVGAPSRTQLGVSNSGAAYIFERNSVSSVWEQKAILFPSDFPTGSRFGYSVSISGTYAIIGAYGKTGGGGAYVFERNSGSGTWTQAANLTTTNMANFGVSVSIKGTYAVVGDSYKTVNSLSQAGGLYVFERISGIWTQTASLDNPDPATSDEFGYDKGVSIDGANLVVGCCWKDPSAKSNAGSAYLYTRNATTSIWENKMKWTASDGLAGDRFGTSVAVSGTHVFSGSPSKTVLGAATAGGVYVYDLPASGTVVPPSATISVTNGTYTAAATVTIGTLGTDATYTYVVSRTDTNSSSATMTDCGTCIAQTSAQSVTLTGLTQGTTYYFWVRSKVTSSGAYAVISSSSKAAWVAAPSGCTLSVNTITPLTCNAAVTLTAVGSIGFFNYFISSATTNSTSASMTDVCGLLRQTTSQTAALSGLSPNTTQYLFVRAQHAVTGVYTVLSTTGTTLATISGVAPSGGTVATPTSVTSTSASVAVTLTTLGTDSIYKYFLSSSPTNSTGSTMTDLRPLTAQTSSQTSGLSLLAPSTTSYLFARALNVKTGAYTFMTTTGVALTTLGTGSAPSGVTITVSSAASTTAVIYVTMTTLGTNANYVYYVSWCATNSVGGTMTNVCLLAKQTAMQTVKPSGLPAGTSPYLFVRAKNILTGAYTMMSSSGTTISLSASSIYYEAASLTAFDPVAADFFGCSVAVSESYAVIGAYNKDPVGLANAGAAYALELNGATSEWEHKSVLYPNDGFSGDNFGISVSLSGTYAIIGAYQSDPGGNSNAGAAYAFERNAGSGVWEQKSKLTASDLTVGALFGNSVSVSGTYAIIGAPNRTQLGVANSGGAYIFERNSTSGVWEQKSVLFPSDLTTASYFGFSVCVSGSCAIVGAYQKAGGGGAYIFECNSGTEVWEEKAIVTCPDSTIALFGYSVSIDGTYAIVGAYGKTVSSLSYAGSAYVFERVSGTWTQTAILDNPDPGSNDQFAYSVSLREMYAVIGSNRKDVGSTLSVGSTYLYKRNSTTGVWENKHEWIANDFSSNDYMGSSVCISGTHVVSGAYQKGVTGITQAGGTYVFELPSSSTPPVASISNASPTTQTASVTISTLGTDASYTYVVSWASTNSTTATMTDFATLTSQTASQTISLSSISTGKYMFVRSKVVSTGFYAVISSGLLYSTAYPPSGGSVSLTSVTQTTASVSVAIAALGTDDIYTYVLSRSSTNSTGATMTDIATLTSQTASQTVTVTGLTAGTAYYLWVRAKNLSDTYTLLMASGTTATTHAVISYTGGTITNVLIYGQSTGQISALTVSGGSGSYTYSWGSGITNPTVNAAKTGLAAGTYSLTITDSVGATKSVDFTITQPAQLVLTPGTVSDITVYGASNGVIGTSTVSGGVSPYSASWSSTATTISDQTSGSKTNLAAGTYTLTVQDTNGAVVSYTYTVLQPLNVISQKTDCSAFGVSDGTASVTIGGGVGPYTTNWYQGSEIGSSIYSIATSLTATPACEYLLVVTDTIGNVFKEIVTITEPQSDVNVVGITPVSASVALNTSRDGAVSDVYTVSYTTPTGEIVYGKQSTSPSFNIVGLLPTTTYIIKIYRVVKRAKNIRTRVAEISVTTSADVVQNYNTSLFSTGDGTYDLVGQKLSNISSDVVSLFNTNDKLKLTTKRTAVQSEARVVKNKTTLSAPKLESVVLPFSQSETEDQSIILSETTSSLTVDVSYNTSTDQVVIGTSAYGEGNVFRVDGKYKVSVSSS